MRPFSLIYYLLALTLYVVALPYLLFLSFKQKYRESIPARFFLKNNPKFHCEGIWFHVCSLGEAKAIAPIVSLLKKRSVNISTITSTGYKEALRYEADVRYLPFEIFLPFWVKKNRMLIVMEAEFWYMLFLSAYLKGSKVVLLNARISDRSVAKYMKMRWFYRKMFALVDIAFVQSEVDKSRFEALGVKNIEVIGNIKLAQEVKATCSYVKPHGLSVVAASTHEGEERLILEAYFNSGIYKDAKLFIVPRHPERFDGVYTLMQTYAKTYGVSIEKFTQKSDMKADIILIDKMGELNNIYAISDIALLAGSFVPDIGGHNPLEPAHFGCKIISGRYYFNQYELYKYVDNICEVKDEATLTKALQGHDTLKKSFVEENIDLEKIIHYIKERE